MSEIVDLFFSHIPACRFVFPDGSEAAFIGGQYATAEKDKIAYLDHEIALKHPTIYRKPEAMQIDSALLDPYEAMRRKVIAEALAAGEIQLTQNSSYTQQDLKPASSAQLVDVKTPEEIMLAAGLKEKEVTDEEAADNVTKPQQVNLAALLAGNK